MTRPRPRRLALSTARAVEPYVHGLEAVEPLLADADELMELCALERREVGRRFRRMDLGQALHNTARLLWGERVTRRIRPIVAHRRQLSVLVVAVDRLTHPNEQAHPRTGAESYNDRARRRLVQWFWAATFADGFSLSTRQARYAEAMRLLTWAAGGPTIPEVFTAGPAPARDRLAEVRYRGGWRYDAVLSLLARRGPRDFLTGERLDVEQRFGARLQGHHLFPVHWCATHPDIVPPERVHSVVNIAPITAYTNTWISGQSPADYVERIQGFVGPRALAEVLEGHLVRVGDLGTEDFDGFWEHRLAAIHRMVVDAVSPERE